MMILDAFKGVKYKSQSKNYKYFYRGQYGVMPDTEDLVQGMKSKRVKLQSYEKYLKNFQYKKALDAALAS